MTPLPMKPTLATLLALAALAGCQPPHEPAPAPAPPAPPPVAPARQDPPMPIKTLDAEQIATTVDDGGSIAVVRVLSSDVEQKGTRSESVRIACELVEAVFGPAAPALTLRRYTSGGDRVLEPGHLYVVTTFPDRRFAPALQLTAFVETTQGQLAETVRAHRALLPAQGR